MIVGCIRNLLLFSLPFVTLLPLNNLSPENGRYNEDDSVLILGKNGIFNTQKNMI